MWGAGGGGTQEAVIGEGAEVAGMGKGPGVSELAHCEDGEVCTLAGCVSELWQEGNTLGKGRQGHTGKGFWLTRITGESRKRSGGGGSVATLLPIMHWVAPLLAPTISKVGACLHLFLTCSLLARSIQCTLP